MTTLTTITPPRVAVGRIGTHTTRGGVPVPDHAVSRDRVWAFEMEDGVCRVTHQPTELVAYQPAFNVAREWAATAGAEAFLREVATDLTRQPWNRTEADLFQGERALLFLDGMLLSPLDVESDSICECGGYLADRRDGWVHVDTCVECRAAAPPEHGLPPLTWAGSCDEPSRHKFCREPEPVQCDHHHCRTPNNINAVPCERYDMCCGCCHGDR